MENESMKLFLKNELRKEKLLQDKKYRIFLVKIIKEEKGHWFRLNKSYIVREYPFQATKDGTTTYCYCNECVKERKDKELFEHYEVRYGKYFGSIIPVYACEVIGSIEI